MYKSKHRQVNGKKSNSKLLETFEARRHVTMYVDKTQRQDKLGTGKKKPNGKI